MRANKQTAMHLLHVAGKTQDGRNVYHCLRCCNKVRREFWFTLKPAAVTGESRSDGRWQFDVRDLPEKYRGGGNAPICWALRALNDGWEPPVERPRAGWPAGDLSAAPF